MLAVHKMSGRDNAGKVLSMKCAVEAGCLLLVSLVMANLPRLLAGEPAVKRGHELPRISAPIMFNTPEADEILRSLQVFPTDNPWNADVSGWPLHADSQSIVESIGREKPLRYNPDMAFIFVPASQPKIELTISGYPGESDRGPYPLPDNLPIEGWPAFYRRASQSLQASLADIQCDRFGQGGDRHAIVVDPANGLLYELYGAKRTDRGWQAASAAIFDLGSNRLRPEGWRSTDAAGLPVFPAIIRYDELKSGMVNHAMRVTVPDTRRSMSILQHTLPATRATRTCRAWASG